MVGKRKGRRGRSLREAAGLVAVYATRKAVQVGWHAVTGKEAPAGPEDREIPLGQAVVWSLLIGALGTTARMFAIRYAYVLLPRDQRQSVPGPATPGKTKRLGDATTSA